MRERTTSRFLIKRQSVCIVLSIVILVALVLFAQAHESKANSNASGDMLAPPAGVPTITTVIKDTTNTAVTSVTVGTPVHDTATLSAGLNPGAVSSTVTYTLFSFTAPPSGTAPCSGGTIVGTAQTVTIVTAGVVPDAAAITPSPAGFYGYSSVFNGDANNNAATSNCEPLTVSKASSTIATTLSATTIMVDGSISDSSALTSAFQAGGTVTYEFFSGSTCAGTATTVGTPVTVTGGVVPSSASQTFTSAGPFSWNAIYSGDVNNNGATSPCEPLTVSKASPSMATTVSAATSLVGTAVHDSTTLTGGFQAGGAVIYTLFSNSACIGTSSTLPTVTVTSGVVPDSTAVTPTPAGSYAFQASYSGDANNNGIVSACEPFTVQDFSIVASDPTPVNLGNPASSPITVNGQAGFKDQVNLSATYPPNLTCSLTPASVTPPASPSSILSCTSTIAGSFSVTVSGSSGQLSHSKTVMVTFGDYTITGTPPAVNVQSGTKNASIITLVNNGYNGRVALGLTGPVIAGLSFSFDAPALNLVPGQSPTTTLTIQTTSSTPAGSYPVSISTDSIVPRSLTVTITVEGNFTMTLAKSQLVVVEGGRAYTSLTLTSNGLSDAVTVYAVPPRLSSGLTGSFNPQAVQLTPGSVATTILAVDSTLQTVPGVYNVTLVGQSNSFRIQHVIYLNLTVSDFSILINPNPVSIPPGQVGNATVYVHGLFSFNGTINLVTYPLRQIQPSLLPNSITLNSTSPLLNSTLTIRVQGSTLPGLYNIRVTGTVGRLVHTVILKLSVVEFSINIPPSIILQVGQSLPTPLTITSQNSFTGTVDLNFTVPLDSGISGQISPPSVGLLANATSSATLTLTGSRPGAYRMNITGTSGVAHSFQYVTVYIGDFTISSSAPSIVIPIGAARTFQLDMGSHFFFSGNITLIVTSDPSGLDISNLGTVTVAPARTAAITVTVSTAHAISGVYDVTVTGTNGPLSHALSLRVIVAAPPLLTVPALQTINQGSLLTFYVSATDSDSSLTISYTTLSPGATTTLPTLPPGATFYPSYRTNSTATTVTGIFNWKPSSSQMPGDYIITFTAQDRNGGVTSRQVTVHVNGAANRSITLPSSPLVWYSLIAVIGIAGTLAGNRIWRNRNMRKASHEQDFHEALGIHGGTSKAEQ